MLEFKAPMAVRGATLKVKTSSRTGSVGQELPMVNGGFQLPRRGADQQSEVRSVRMHG
jgi:hypothetical protein